MQYLFLQIFSPILVMFYLLYFNVCLIFRLKKQDLVFCCSNMTSDVKERVLEKVKKLGIL